MSPLALRLLALRSAAGLSQARLATLAGVRQATISALETGRSRRVDFTTIEALAKVLGVEPHEMFATDPLKRRR